MKASSAFSGSPAASQAFAEGEAGVAQIRIETQGALDLGDGGGEMFGLQQRFAQRQRGHGGIGIELGGFACRFQRARGVAGFVERVDQQQACEQAATVGVEQGLQHGGGFAGGAVFEERLGVAEGIDRRHRSLS